jgi:hypothetical protein
MKNTLVTATTIAYTVRDWVEKEAFRKNYHPDNLLGWCAIASAELHKRLKKEGIKADICVSTEHYMGSHCYIVIEDHVLDVTATQFDTFKNTKVVIMHSKEAEVHEMYRAEKVFGTSKELRVYQNKQRWPSKQIAYA